MQDRYAGDVGDFIKLGLLRAITPGLKLGVIWYKIPNEDHNNDGRHTSYLSKPEKFSALDQDLFRHLGYTVSAERSIASLLSILGNDATSFDESIDLSLIHSKQRRSHRQSWFTRALRTISACDVVFADPDNGIVDNADWRKGRKTFGKQIPLAEVKALATERCAVIYHHNTRRTGGHDAEVDHWLGEINKPCIAIRARAYSPRTFFIVNPTEDIEVKTEEFCAKWNILGVSFHESE